MFDVRNEVIHWNGVAIAEIKRHGTPTDLADAIEALHAYDPENTETKDDVAEARCEGYRDGYDEGRKEKEKQS